MSGSGCNRRLIFPKKNEHSTKRGHSHSSREPRRCQNLLHSSSLPLERQIPDTLQRRKVIQVFLLGPRKARLIIRHLLFLELFHDFSLLASVREGLCFFVKNCFGFFHFHL